jgi:LAO/AO transport system kinase
MGPAEIEDLVEGVSNADRNALGRAITLVESTKAEDQIRAGALLQRLLPSTGGAHRIGITGIPGVGKSTFIDELGTMLTAKGHRVAVLAVDPSSSVSGGSILGDKTRMPRLAVDPAAFIRPSPSLGTLGGVTRTTRETMLVLEAAGYDVVLVETIGVGQSETVVAEMVDFFLVLMLPGAGDELQGIKKGVLELADMLAVNKADGDNQARARTAARDYQAALRLLSPTSSNWTPPVMTCSGLTGEGLGSLWDQIKLHRERLSASGEWDERRRSQRLRWMWAMVEHRLIDELHAHSGVQRTIAATEAAVTAGDLSPSVAAHQILETFGIHGSGSTDT